MYHKNHDFVSVPPASFQLAMVLVSLMFVPGTTPQAPRYHSPVTTPLYTCPLSFCQRSCYDRPFLYLFLQITTGISRMRETEDDSRIGGNSGDVYGAITNFLDPKQISSVPNFLNSK